MTHDNGSGTTHTGNRYDNLSAAHMTVERSAVRSIEADQAMVERSAVQRLRARQVDFRQGGIGIASFDQGTIRQGTAGAVVARSVACDEVRTGILVSPVVRGEVHTWLDMRSAVAIGAGMVLGKALLAGGRALARRAMG